MLKAGSCRDVEASTHKADAVNPLMNESGCVVDKIFIHVRCL